MGKNTGTTGIRGPGGSASKQNLFMRRAIETGSCESEPSRTARVCVDIESCEDLFPWLYNYLVKFDVRNYNVVLVDYAEYILADPYPYGDAELNYNIKGPLSFLGYVLRRTAETTETRPYSAALIELAGSIHARIDDGSGYEAACDMAFYLADLKSSGLFKVKRQGGGNVLVGTKKLKRQHGITVRIALSEEFWGDLTE